MDYECHVTIPRGYRKYGKLLAEVLGFSYSEILGDPDLGEDKALAYLNGKFRDLSKARVNIALMVNLCQSINVPVLRSKIELILEDIRYEDVSMSDV
jgi:hypothetical protein